jgi:hypothetical protein
MTKPFKRYKILYIMFHYICELFQKIFSNIKLILYVYYTQLPNLLYKQATCEGNMAFAGIGLGLLNCKKIFWFSKIGIFIMTYFKYYTNLNNYFYYFVCFILIYTLITSLIHTIKLGKYLKIP